MVNLKRRSNTQQQATIYRAKNTNVLSDTILPPSKVYFKREDYIYNYTGRRWSFSIINYSHINVLLYCYVIKIYGLTSISLLLTQIMMNQLFRDAYRFPCNTLTTEQVLSYMERGGGGATWICSTAGLVTDRPTCYSQSHTTDVQGCSQMEDSH